MTKHRRANAEGSIYYRDSRQRWEAALTIGRDAAGKPIRRTFTGKTRKDVTAKLEAAKATLEQGLVVPEGRTTIADFAGWWLAEVMPGEGLAPKTEIFYEQNLRSYVLPEVGHRTLTGPAALTPQDVEAMATALERRGLSTRVQVAARTTLGKVLRAAEVRGLVGRNVARLAKAPRDRGAVRKVKAFNSTEVRTLLDAVDGTRWYPLVVVAVTTGLRPGELLALHWADVHLDGDPRVSVRHSLSMVRGAALKAPKRPRSYRTVPLPAEAVVALKAWRKQQAAEQLAIGELWCTDWPGLVFTTEGGLPNRVELFRSVMLRAIDGAHPHRLRHTYATHLLEAGTPIHHVAELLGNTVAVVESTYSHVLRPKYETAAVAAGILG